MISKQKTHAAEHLISHQFVFQFVSPLFVPLGASAAARGGKQA